MSAYENVGEDSLYPCDAAVTGSLQLSVCQGGCWTLECR